MVEIEQDVPYDGDLALVTATRKHNIHLGILVAETGLWAHPEVHRQFLAENGTGAYYSNTRRYQPGEKDGAIIDGVRVDSNVYARYAILGVTGVQLAPHSYHACHMWPGTCRNPRYYTVVANLVLLPSAIAGLSDYDSEVRDALQYRAYDLYGWYPTEEPVPVLPKSYPDNWREPLPFTETIIRRVKNWRVRQQAIAAIPTV